MKQDIAHDVKVVHLVDAQSITGTLTSSLLDLDCEFEGVGVLINWGLNTGGVADTNYFTAKLQHADSTLGSAFVDVPAADLIGTFITQVLPANDNSSEWIGYKGIKRYLRLVLTETGTVTSQVVSADFILGYGRRMPAGVIDGAAQTITLESAT